MKKKGLIISLISIGVTIVSIILIIALVFIFNRNEHQHSIAETVINPTCQSKGYTKHYCTKCDYYYEDTFIEEIDHNLVSNVIEEPTCKSEGKEEVVCTMCGEKTIHTISKKFNHESLEVKYYGEYCEGNHVGYIICKECNDIVDVIGHNVKTTILQPSCTEYGLKTVSCTKCNLIISEDRIAPLDHMNVEEIIVLATCLEDGKIDTFCVDCGEILSTEIITKKEHKFISSKIDTTIKYECVDCDYSYEVLDVENSYKIMLVSKLDDSNTELDVKEGDSVILPILDDFDNIFLGWYYEEEGINLYNSEPIYDNTTLYGLWQQETISESYEENTVERNVSKTFTFKVSSKVVLNNSNINNYISVKDSNNKKVPISVKKDNAYYVVSSNSYLEGETYVVETNEDITLLNRKGNKFYFSIKKDNVNNIEYKENVIILNRNDIVNYYTNNHETYIYLVNALTKIDKPYVLIDDNSNLLGTYNIIDYEYNNGYYIYRCEDAKAEDVFKKFEIHYSGEIGLQEENISYSLEEDLVREFKKSRLYKQFNDAIDEFVKSETNRKYSSAVPTINLKVILKDSTLKIILEIKSTLRENGDEKISIILKAENVINIETDLNAQLFDQKANVIIEADNEFSISLTARILDDKFDTFEEECTLKKIKEIYKSLKIKDDLEIKENKTDDISRIKIYEGEMLMYGPIAARIGIYANFEWYTIGEVGISYTYHTNLTMLANVTLNDITVHSNVENNSYFSAVVMGKTALSERLELSLSIGIVRLGSLGLSVEVGPQVEMGGMGIICVDENDVTTIKKSYYVAAELVNKLNFVFESDVFKDQKIELKEKEYPIFQYGSKKVPLGFEKTNEEYKLNVNFGDQVDLSKLIDRYAILYDFDSMSTTFNKIDCDYALAMILNRYDNISINGNILSVNPSISTEFDIKIAVTYGDLRKDVTLKIKINHQHDYQSEIIEEPSCNTSGKIKYVCSCDSFYEEIIYPTGHNFVDGECSCGALDNSQLVIDNLNLQLMEDGCYEIVGYIGEIEYLYIPTGNDDIKITSIGYEAFYNCSSLISVVIPENITNISWGAFLNCENLMNIIIDSNNKVYDSRDNCNAIIETTINTLIQGCNSTIIPDDVTSIGDWAFLGCSSLESIEIPNSVTSIGDYAFVNCNSLESIEIPSSVTSIGSDTFRGCSSLKSVEIPNSVTSIGSKAFSGCSSLKSVEIPNSVTYIGMGAFSGCSSLESITLSFVGILNGEFGYIFGAKYYTENNEYVPASLKEVIVIDGTNISFYECASIESITLPDSITCIESRAFFKCSSLESIEIPNGVISIGEYAFSDCHNLTSVVIPDSVTAIGKFAFSDCYNLTSLDISGNVIGIGESSFENCINLKNVYYNGTLEKWCNIEFINSYSNPMYCTKRLYMLDSNSNYYEITNMEEIVIPNTVTRIGNYQFACFDNIVEIEIPNSVTYIGSGAFFGCHFLARVFYNGTIEDWCKIEFGNEYSNPMYFARLCFMLDDNMEYYEVINIEISNSINAIGKYQFISFENIENVILSDSITSIGEFAFYGCSSLESIEIPSGVTSIGSDTFRGCSSLKSVEIPNSVTSIGSSAFYNCSSLKSVEIPNSVTSIGKSAFSGCSSLENVYYTGTIEDWCNIEFGSVASNPMYYAKHFYMKDSNNEYYEVTGIEIPNTIKSIGNYQFNGFINLTKVKISDSVTSIGSSAFRYCNSLESIVIGNGVITIGNYAFDECGSLINVTIGDSVTSIDEYAFSGCSSLESIVIPASITSIGEYAFLDCDGLTRIELPNSVTSVGEGAFARCSSLTIYCEVTSKPSGWDSSWNSSNRPVYWGYTK